MFSLKFCLYFFNRCLTFDFFEFILNEVVRKKTIIKYFSPVFSTSQHSSTGIVQLCPLVGHRGTVGGL